MVQSLERAFAILDEVAQRPAGVTAIAERVRLPVVVELQRKALV